MTKFNNNDIICNAERGCAKVKRVYTSSDGNSLYELQHIGRQLGIAYMPSYLVDTLYGLCECDMQLHNDAMAKLEFCINEILASDFLPQDTVAFLRGVLEMAGTSNATE